MKNAVTFEGNLAATGLQHGIHLYSGGIVSLKGGETTISHQAAQKADDAALKLAKESAWSSEGLLSVNSHNDMAIQITGATFKHTGALQVNGRPELAISSSPRPEKRNVLSISNNSQVDLEIDHPLTIKGLDLSGCPGTTLTISCPALTLEGPIIFDGTLIIQGEGSFDPKQIQQLPGGELDISKFSQQLAASSLGEGANSISPVTSINNGLDPSTTLLSYVA